ncbi:glycosyltransferase family 4 protein [Calothrix sp. 336/3]|uniref:glycosyltransferase family 4 protein n=1 Tax=Calothrix sp. 336/3 TaxID=1337936 RepID=UPI00062435F2|nr:glycosyltransferase family 4 protein [Calothrix sp. 336/3]AKG22688.1 hypothetical protein IJ00_16670 [Calothrix sp. 336/3]
MKKPTILHILNDINTGGIVSNLKGIHNSRLSQNYDFQILDIKSAKAALPSLKPDLIILNQVCNWRFLPDIFWLKQFAKILIHEHHYSQGFEEHNVTHKIRFRSMLRLAYGLADCVIAVSQGQANWMKEAKLVNQKKVRFIQQCPNLERFFNVSSQNIHQPLRLATYGRFCPQKGFDILIQAMEALRHYPVELVIGGYGEEEEKLKTMTADNPNIHFVGKVQDVPKFLEECDVVVIPSRWEPWGNVCLEAKAAAKPVIVSDIDGLSEQIDNCGVLIKPNDREELTRVIGAIATQNHGELLAWGVNGRESVKHNWEKYLTSWEETLSQLITKKSYKGIYLSSEIYKSAN